MNTQTLSLTTKASDFTTLNLGSRIAELGIDVNDDEFLQAIIDRATAHVKMCMVNDSGSPLNLAAGAMLDGIALALAPYDVR